MKVKILADSAGGIPKDVAKKYDIEIVPLEVIFGKEVYKDGVDISDAEFFCRLENGGVHPTTSQINVQTWADAFGRFAVEYDLLVCVTVSAELSGTHHSAVLASEGFEKGKVLVLDSRTMSISAGAITAELAKFVSAGVSGVSDVQEKFCDLLSRIELFATFESLKYLKEGGRLSGTQLMIGNMIKLKLLLTTKDGKAYICGKVISTKKAISKIKENLKETMDLSMPVYFGEGAYENEALEIIRDYQGEIGFSDWSLFSVGAVVGVHTGPRAFGVAYFRKG